MRTFSARETEWLLELDGLELANFWPRAIAFVVDWILICVAVSVLATLGTGAYLGARRLEGKPLPSFVHDPSTYLDDNAKVVKEEKVGNANIELRNPGNTETVHIVTDIVLPILYFGILLWKGKGRTPGKRLMKIRVVSIVHRHLSFWHSVERALGYGAAALELGFGFVQFFIHPYRRCAQDRLAETIVITERSYRANQHKFQHPLVPDGRS
jgi:uncharacterized RDD family membrane protein YckC